MGSVTNPFSGSDFTWTPSAAAGSKQISTLAKYVGTSAVATAQSFALADKSATDFVVTVQCLNTDGKYFRRDLRGAWYKNGATVTAKDTPSGSGDASGNESSASYSADLDLSGSDVRVRLKGVGRWSISVNRLVTAHTPFDPLAYGTPICWLNSAAGITEAGDNTEATAFVNQAGGTAAMDAAAGEYPIFKSANSTYAGAPTLEFRTGKPGIALTGHGLQSGAFTVVFVGSGKDAFWMQDANGTSVISAGGGSGNKPQISNDAGTYLASGTAGSDVAGVFIFVFDGSPNAKIYVSKKSSPTTNNAGALQNKTGVKIGVGNAATPTTGGKMDGSIRHFLVYSGALSHADCGELLDGFGTESGITITA